MVLLRTRLLLSSSTKRPRPGGFDVELDIPRPPPRPAGHLEGSGASAPMSVYEGRAEDNEWGGF